MAGTANVLFSQLCEPALHLIDPGRVGGREVEVEAGVSEQPAVDQRRLVGAVIVQDEMHLQVGWHLRVDAIQKLAELGGSVSAMYLADDFASGDIQGGKQRRGAVTFVVVGTPLGLSWSHRQRRLRTIERLKSGSFHQRTTPAPVQVGRDTDRRCRGPSRSTAGRSTT